MATEYNTKSLTNLGQLKKLANRTKTELDTLGARVDSLKTEIDSKIASTYKPGGTKTAEELTSTLLIAANEGKVYNISTKLTINSGNKDLFVEGAESSYPVGTNFVVVNTTEGEGAASYKFDALAGFVDLSGYMEKADGSGAGKLASITAGGGVQASNIDASDVEEALESIEGKADTVDGATDGHLAGLDGDGNLTDSNIAAADVVTKIASPTADNLLVQSTEGKLADSGIAKGDVQTKLTGATTDNLLAVGADGKMKDSGVGIATDADVEAMISEVFDSED